MAGEAARFSQIIDLLWDKNVPTLKKTNGADKMVKHLMGSNYTVEAFATLSNDQKADAILTSMRASFMKLVEAGGQIEKKAALEQEIIDAGNLAVDDFNPDL